jgi:hypothetical protein
MYYAHMYMNIASFEYLFLYTFDDVCMCMYVCMYVCTEMYNLSNHGSMLHMVTISTSYFRRFLRISAKNWQFSRKPLFFCINGCSHRQNIFFKFTLLSPGKYFSFIFSTPGGHDHGVAGNATHVLNHTTILPIE